MPSFLLSLSTDAWPTVLLIRKEVLCTLDIGNHISSSCFECLSTGNNGALDIDCAFDLQLLVAFSVDVEVIDKLGLNRGLGIYGEAVDGDGGDEKSECEHCDFFHCRIIYMELLIVKV